MVSTKANGTGLATDFTTNGILNEAIPDAPTSFAFGSDGDLYATAQHTNADGSQNDEILRLNPSAIQITTFPLTDSGQAIGNMTLGPDGDVWFADTNSEQIGKIAPDGTLSTIAYPQPLTVNDSTAYFYYSGLRLTPGSGGAVWYASMVGVTYKIATDGSATLMPQGFVPPDGENDANSDGQGGSWSVEPNASAVDHNLTNLPDPGVTLTPFSWQSIWTGGSYNGNLGELEGSFALGTFTSTDPNASASDFVAYVDSGPATIVANPDGGFSILATGLDLNLAPDRISISVVDLLDHHATSASSTGEIVIGTLESPVINDFKVQAGQQVGESSSGGPVGFSGWLGVEGGLRNWWANVWIDWGDGTASLTSVSADYGSSSFFGSDHIYQNPGKYTVTVTASDSSKTTTSTCTATVTSSPTISQTSQNSSINTIMGQPFQQQVFSFESAESDAVASDFTAEINWGGSTTSDPATITGSGGDFTVTGGYTYDLPGTYTATVSVRGVGSYPDEATGSITARVGYPTISQASAVSDVSFTAGQDALVTFANFQISPGPGYDFDYAITNYGNVTATIDYGDGTQTMGGIEQVNSGGEFAVVSHHIYSSPGTRTFTVTVQEPGSSQAPVVVTGTLDVVGPAVTRAEILATEDQPTDFTTGDFQYLVTAFPASYFSATIDWGDGTASVGTVTPGSTSGSLAIEGSHTYHQSGSLPISATLTGSTSPTPYGVFSTTASVAPSPITTSAQFLTGTEGISLADGLLATFTSLDPASAAKDFSASIDWGDGTTSAGTVRADPFGGFDVVGSHTYRQGGDYHPAVTIGNAVDAGGGSISSVTSEADIDFLPLAVNATPISATTGQAFSGPVVTFSSGDSSLVAADFTTQIDWGDGSAATSGQVVANPSGGFSVTGTHTYTTARNDTISVMISRASAVAPSTVAKVSAVVTSPPAPPVISPPVVIPPTAPTSPPTSTPVPASSPATGSSPIVPPAPSAAIQVLRNGSIEIIASNLVTIPGVSISNVSSYRVTIAGKDGKLGTKDDRVVKVAKVISGAGGSSVTIVPKGTFARGTLFSIVIGGKESMTATFPHPLPKAKVRRA